MAPPRTLAIIMAGGAGDRLELLTERRAKPVVPIGGSYRLIDFPLSNCAHSGIGDVWVVQQTLPASLGEVLGNGRPWDLDRSTGGLRTLPPSEGNERSGSFSGTADALWKVTSLVREFAPAALVVASADAIYRLDLHEVVVDHLASDALATMVTTNVDEKDASRLGTVKVDSAGLVTDFDYKPDQPATTLVSNEVFVFDGDRVLDVIDDLDDDGERELGNLQDTLIPALVDAGDVRAHRFDCYWRDVGHRLVLGDTHGARARQPTVRARRRRLADPDRRAASPGGEDPRLGPSLRQPAVGGQRCRRPCHPLGAVAGRRHREGCPRRSVRPAALCACAIRCHRAQVDRRLRRHCRP